MHDSNITFDKMSEKKPSSIWLTAQEKDDLKKIKGSVSGIWHWTMRVVHHIAERGSPPPCIYLDIKRKKNGRRELAAEGAMGAVAQDLDPCEHCPAGRAAAGPTMIELEEFSELTAYMI
jgi:hypothetical protein